MDMHNQVKNPRWPLANASVRFRTSLLFDDGEQRVELIRMGPAHTAGDGVVYLPKQEVLFVGDLAVNWTHGNNLSDPEVDCQRWLRVLDQLAAWRVKVVVPAHGDLGTTGTLYAQRTYLSAVLRQVQAGIRRGKSVNELVKENDLARYERLGADPEENADAIRDAYRYLTSRVAQD